MPQPIEQQFADADVLIENAQSDPDISEAFASVGKDGAFFEEGRTRLDEVRSLHQKQQAEYGEQYAATDDLHDKKDAAHDTYVRHVQLARLALEEDTAAQEALQLRGRRQQSIDGWLDQAQGFYDNLAANDTWTQALAGYGVTKEDASAARAKVDAVAEARRAQERERGEAQQATVRRDEALDALGAWMYEATRLARISLDGQRQKLEELGIMAR